jgi:hypothetical protein
MIAAVLLASCGVATSCAALNDLARVVQPPQFAEAPGRPAELRIIPPGGDYRSGGAGIRLWARVHNPNGFGLTISTLRGTLLLEDVRAADVDFPLGLPLGARQESVVPLDLALGFDDVPGLARLTPRLLAGEPVGYSIEGTVGVDAGPLGRPTFGPMLVLAGRFDTR